MTEKALKKSAPKKSAAPITEAQKNKAQKIAEAIRLVKIHKAQNRLTYWKPYQWQKDFYKAGTENKQRMLMAANRVGKTASQAAEVAFHLTGLYPDWWEGIRFTRPTRIWCLGVSGEQLRDVIVKELLGMYLGEGKFDGSGLVPQRLIFQVTPAMGTPRLPRDVAIRHTAGNLEAIA